MKTNQAPNFSNIAGYDEVKEELLTIFKWYKDPKLINNKYTALPTGILFYGDPGNGKTLFIREYIRAFNAPTYIVKGKEHQIEEIQTIFKKARKEKFAIIAIDELDMLIDDNRDIERVLQSELDGIDKKGSILVLASTNKIAGIGKPLQRQGRFDRVIHIAYPGIEERATLFRYYFSKFKINPDGIDIYHMCNVCSPLTCAEIKAVINDAYLRSNGNITTAMLEESYERLQGRDFIKINPLLFKDYPCAIHEAGHVIMTLKYPDDYKVYSVKFDRGGGTTKTYPADSRYKLDKVSDILKKMQIALSGAIAEQLFFKNHDEGMQDDLEKTYRMAKEITDFVCDKNFRSFVPRYCEEYDRVDTNVHKLKNEKRINKLIRKQAKLVKHYLKKHKNEIRIIADALYNKGMLTYHDIYNLLGLKDGYIPNETIKKTTLAYAKKTN